MFKKILIILLLTMSFIPYVMADTPKYTLDVKDVIVTEALTVGSPVCIFFKATIVGLEKIQNATAELKAIASEDGIFVKNPAGKNQEMEVIKRSNNSNLKYCNDSGDVINSLPFEGGNLNLTPTTQYIRVYEINKPLKAAVDINSKGDIVFLNLNFNIAGENVPYQALARVVKYEDVLGQEQEKLEQDAKKRDELQQKNEAGAVSSVKSNN